MSQAARTALLSIGTNRQGATPAPTTPVDALAELEWLGLIGKGQGLTRKGTIKRELLVSSLMDLLS